MLSGSNTATPSPSVTSYWLGDEAILFVGDTGQLLRLNSTAALIWKGLESGLTLNEVTVLLVDSSGSAMDEIRRDVLRLTAELRAAGAFLRSVADGEEKRPESAETLSPFFHEPVDVQLKDHLVGEHIYRLVDLRFRLRTPTEAINEAAHELLGHLAGREVDSFDVALDVVRDQQDGKDRWLLLRNSDVVDKCNDPDGIIPMLHGNLLLMAYWSSGCMAAVHAAAVIRQGSCILMPAVAGSGKSTLTAALLAEGFAYCTDDLALLTSEPIRVRPVPTCLGLKSGSWDILAKAYPGILDAPIYRRADGKQIRYLSPPSLEERAPDESFAVGSVVFPVYREGAATRLRPVGAAEGLSRLAEAGYDLPNRISKEIVESLVRWISGIPCFELQYEDLGQAVAEIATLT